MTLVVAEGESLFAQGFESELVESYRERAAAAAREILMPRVEDAERERRFPRAAITELANTGLWAERWSGELFGDAGRGVILSEEFGRSGVGGLALGASVHFEAAVSILKRYGRSDYLRSLLDDALAGQAIGCIAASEDSHGSDLTGMDATASREGEGWRIRGTKAFVSLGAVADFALVLCRVDGEVGDGVPQLIVACVPKNGFRVAQRLKPLGARALETVRLEIDATIGEEAILGSVGSGLMVASWGLTHERLSSAAQLVGGLGLAVGVAVAHTRRRHQFGVRLEDHQVLRHRLAAIHSETMALRLALYGFASLLTRKRPQWIREVAAFKFQAVRLAERAVSDCMHTLGGIGFLEDRTPFPRLWRDVRLGRLGGGTDEMMLELVAAGLKSDDAAYEEMVSGGAPA